MKKIISKVAVVVLAAGESHRMGEPKQLLPWKNLTLLEHVVQNALQIEADEVSVVLGANFIHIKNQLKNYPVHIIQNTNWEAGLGKSISIAASYYIQNNSQIEGLMFILADQPFVTKNYLTKMLEKFQPHKKQICATQYPDDNSGVPIIFDRFYFNELSSLKGDQGANALVKKHKTFVEVLKAPFDNTDIDSKEDYLKASVQMYKS